MEKSSVTEIKKRFDQDVNRFSDLSTGQTSTVDAALSLELITEAAVRLNPQAETLLDVGCGAGNYSLKMLSKVPDLACTLVDLSYPMLERAKERISGETKSEIKILQGDIREVQLPASGFDIILAGAVLHHLRGELDWENMFSKLFRLLKPGGCLFISDLVAQETDELTSYTWERWGNYLEALGGREYRNKVHAYVAKEDTPRSITYQLDLMRKVGFSKMEVLHKNMCFGAFGGIKKK